MSTSTAPALTQLETRIAADAYWHLIRTLRRALPPPPTDDPEDLVRRDHAAIACIAGLCPTNATEADVAGQYVAASEQWKEYLRFARQPGTTPERRAACRARADAMMRQANSALRLLLRMQQLRAKLEADHAACNSRAWTEHVATRLMAEALQDLQPHANQPAAPPPAEAAAASAAAAAKPSPLASAAEGRPGAAGRAQNEPAPQPHPAAAPSPGAAGADAPAPAAGRNAVPVGEPEPDPACSGPGSALAEAELFAAIYPERAALIRRLGRAPDDVSLAPADDDVVQALITADTPALAALDHALADPRVA